MLRLCLLLCCLAPLCQAAPARYELDTARSEVAFIYTYEGAERTGVMPVQSADILIDLENAAASQVSVTLNAAHARAGFVFATEAMKGPEVLDTGAHPAIRFRSTAFRGGLDGTVVTGDLTLRGVTRPITLQARLYRQQGSKLDDFSRLTILLTGQIDRRDFGAAGYPDLVGPGIGLRILARITR